MGGESTRHLLLLPVFLLSYNRVGAEANSNSPMYSHVAGAYQMRQMGLETNELTCVIDGNRCTGRGYVTCFDKLLGPADMVRCLKEFRKCKDKVSWENLSQNRLCKENQKRYRGFLGVRRQNKKWRLYRGGWVERIKVRKTPKIRVCVLAFKKGDSVGQRLHGYRNQAVRIYLVSRRSNIQVAQCAQIRKG